MSYEKYRGYRLAPDYNGCTDVLTSDYEQVGTYPSKAAAKRAIDELSSRPLDGMRFEVKIIGSDWIREWQTTPVDEKPELIDYYFKKFAKQAKLELSQRLSKTDSQTGGSQNASGDPKRKATT